ncbi:MAG: energy-coupling factor transporter transmembrane component T [Clostridia bacterium]|uniref:energy-coupling factor transporter transmembrane component T family protein n=1 Tax=Mogibacterium sp. TaxID=2049035 RepID=UPI002584FF0B|nr:energy-coupling factor transporter transmembrane component T [Mogibacterium sp.]MCI7124500.1 energy-coupling factor transporter transmembrane protein EcfT [Mogibacterium sp.]MEE0369985.1 energy-coupling factor transporter transmembrane component T [Clostridia bacterium]
MIRDITLGQYYPEQSVIHRLDARTKILGTLLYIIEIFLVNSFAGFGLVILALGVLIGISKVPVRFIFKGLKAVVFIILLTFLLNLFMFDGTVLWHWKFLTITYEGLYRSCFMALRLILLIIGTSMLTLTTKPMELTDGLEKLLKPFNRFGLPSHEIALMMSIALRFIPTLLEETDKIMKAQQARGADFESGNLIQRVKNMIPILIPLFVGSFRIAQDLALAMEARCYHGGVGRTRMKEIVFSRRDGVAGVLLAVFLGIVIASRWMPLP